MMMPIAMNPPEPDVRPGRQSGADAGGRKAAGSAFEGAIRAVQGKGADKGPSTRSDAADVLDQAGEEGASGGVSDKDTATAADGSKRPSGAAGDALPQLGDVLALLTLPARGGEANEQAAAGEEGQSASTPGADATDGTAPELGLDRTRLRLAVLRMETHFEPTMQTPVLVEAEAATTDAALEAKGIAEILDGLQKTLGADMTGKDRQPAALAAIGAAVSTLARLEGDLRREAKAAVGQADKARAEIQGNAAATRIAEGIATAAAEIVSARETPMPRGLAASFRDADRSSVLNVATPAGAPTTLPTMSAQVAATVIDALPAPEATGSQTVQRAPAEAELRMRAGGAALKTLTIQLQPEHLGVLDISMRLVDGQLSLELSADKADTARLLLEDRAGLKGLLEQAGFSLDEASISIVARETTAQTGGGRGGDTPNGDRSSAEGRRDDGAGQESGRSFGDEGRERPARRPDLPGSEPRTRASGSVFL